SVPRAHSFVDGNRHCSDGAVVPDVLHHCGNSRPCRLTEPAMSDDIEVAEASQLRSREMPQRAQPIGRAVGDLAESDFRRRPSPIARFESYRLHKITFILMVLLPVLAASLYYGLWASDQYAAEIRFGVRQAQVPIVGDDLLAMLAKGMAVTTTGR